MPLKLRLRTSHALPIDLRSLSAAIDRGSSAKQIARLGVHVGKREKRIGECFDVSGELGAGRELYISGDLKKVHSIGYGLTGGRIVIQSDAGDHVGSGMSGGEIFIDGNVGDYAGAEMTGGVIEVAGNARDFVGANLAGAKYGINGGEIIIQGSAGKGLGRRMRRGIIVVSGDVGALAAWNMLAGTIIVFGKSAGQIATDIHRGTVILAGGTSGAADATDDMLNSNRPQGGNLGAEFSIGGTCEPQIVRFLATWLKGNYSDTLGETVNQKLLGRSFVQYAGVALNKNRAEIYVAV